MRALQRFENRLEQAVSGVFARAFRSAVQPVEISAALQREVDNNAQILSRDRRLVPNGFHVELSSTDLDRLSPYDSAMGEELTAALRDHATQQGYVFPGPVTIDFEPAEDLTTGRFRVRSQAVAGVTQQSPPAQPGQAAPGPAVGVQRPAASPRPGQPRVLLEVNGVRHPLEAPGLVVGRGTDADLRISDPGISRRHIEFGVVPGPDGRPAVWVRDLGSTNGMLVDGVKIGQSPLRDGSHVRIGSTTLTLRLVEDDASRQSEAPGHV